MKEVLQSITKFASLGVIVILLYFGVELVKNTTSVSWAGSGLIFVGITLAVISFTQWSGREEYEHLVKQQSLVIRDLSRKINEATKTSVAMEKYTRTSISNTGITFSKINENYISSTETGTKND